MQPFASISKTYTAIRRRNVRRIPARIALPCHLIPGCHRRPAEFDPHIAAVPAPDFRSGKSDAFDMRQWRAAGDQHLPAMLTTPANFRQIVPLRKTQRH
jgi:hypothetical protein